MKKQYLKKILSSSFIKFSLIPILIVEVTLIILYFSINKYISMKNIELMLSEAKNHSQNLLKNEENKISEKLSQVSVFSTILQKEHEQIFKNQNNIYLPNGNPTFNVSPNGVFYKTNEIGSSLYYSAQTKMTQKEKEKATFTEAMDISLKGIVDTNPLIVAAYFNSFDNMNRLYPFIPKVYEQYGEHINMEDYNFYYLADNKHNPSKKPTWTSAYLDPAGNGWMLSCVVPIYNNDFLEGVTGLDITIDQFVKEVLNAKLPYNASLFLVDNEGMIIAMPEKIEELLGLKELKEHLYTDVLLKTIEKPEEYNLLKNKSPFAQHFKSLMSGTKSYDLNIKGKDYFTFMENIKETNWKIMILIDKNEIFNSIEELKELTNKIGYAAIFLLLVFYTIFFTLLLRKINIFSSKITKPIEDLSTQTTLMTQKDIDFTPINTEVAEISILSENFEYMIKELKTNVYKLNEARIVAENANKSKDDFLANVSHELKTPLNSINILSELMTKNKNQSFDEKELKSLYIINKCGKDLIYLINDILDYSKLNAGKLELYFENLDVKNIINEITTSFETQFSAKHINFEVNIDEKVNEFYSDSKRVSQIINNLLSNAVKFTPENKSVYLNVFDEGERIRIIVKDEGIGIPEEKLEIIFDRFSQVDSTTSRKFGGTGLGLTICSELVNLLNGEIKVSSILNEGTTFEIILPKNVCSIEDTKNLQEINNTNIKQVTKKVAKKFAIFYNQNPIVNMTKAIDLKKRFDLIQNFKFEELLESIKDREFDYVIVEEDKISKEEVDRLKELIQDKLVYIQHLEDL